MARGPKPVPLTLSDEERTALEGIVRRRSTGQALAQRARIVLACADPGSTNADVARRLKVSRPSVITWRQRFLAHRLGGLVDQPRSGAPRRVGDDEIEHLIVLTLETQPEGATHWSTRAMAKRAGMSQTMVSRVWRAFGLQPHRQERIKLSTDPAFVDKVRDVVGLYLSPPERALVLDRSRSGKHGHRQTDGHEPHSKPNRQAQPQDPTETRQLNPDYLESLIR